MSAEHGGVWTYQYQPAKTMNDVDLQRQLGFCNPKTPKYFDNTYVQQDGCTPSGLMDVSSCLPGKPRIYISAPHFYGSHPALRQALNGISEPTSDDGTVLGIEPKAGAVVFAQQKSQLNVGIINGSLASLNNMSAHIVPIIWLNESAIFDEATRAQLMQLQSIFALVGTLSVILYALSAVCAFVIAFSAIGRLRQRSDDLVLLLQDDEDNLSNRGENDAHEDPPQTD